MLLLRNLRARLRLNQGWIAGGAMVGVGVVVSTYLWCSPSVEEVNDTASNGYSTSSDLVVDEGEYRNAEHAILVRNANEKVRKSHSTHVAPWDVVNSARSNVKFLLEELHEYASEEHGKEDCKKALRSALECFQWGDYGYKFAEASKAAMIIRNLVPRAGLEEEKSAAIVKVMDVFDSHVQAFHEAVGVMSSMAYAVTSDEKAGAVDLPYLRWVIADIMTKDDMESGYRIPPNLVSVKTIHDSDFATRAFVCISYTMEKIDDAAAGERGRASGAGSSSASPSSSSSSSSSTTSSSSPPLSSSSPSSSPPSSSPSSDEGDIIDLIASATHRHVHAREPGDHDAILRRTFDVMCDDPPPGWRYRADNAVIVFTGTETFSMFFTKHIWMGGHESWLQSLNPCGDAHAPLLSEEDGVGGAAHGMWLRMFRHMHGQLREALKDRDGNTDYLSSGTVWILGHSLGAALATLAAPFVLNLSEQWNGKRTSVYLSTIASPRVLDRTAANAVAKLREITIQRFVLPDDFAPSFPLHLAHVGFHTKVKTPDNVKGSIFKPWEAHKAVSYLRAFREGASPYEE